MAAGFKTGGRSAGTPNKLTQAMRSRIEHDADPIGFLIGVQKGEPVEIDGKQTSPTLEQRISAATTLARKVSPDAKDRPVEINLPKIEGPADAVVAMSSLLSSLAEGKVTPIEAQAISGVIETYRRTVETEDIERRLVLVETQSR